MRTDVLQRLKAMGADDKKIAALRAQFDDDTIAALIGQIEQAAQAASENKIAYKEAAPMVFKPNSIYNKEAAQADQLAAILERVAIRQEDRVFGHYKQGRFDQALKEARALEAISYKAAAGDAIDQLGRQFHELLRAAGDDEAKAWYEQAIAEMQADEEGDAQPAMQPSAKVTDSGLMSAQKAVKPYRPADDPFAIGTAADQLDQGQRVAALDMRLRS